MDPDTAAIIHRLLDKIDALECELRSLRSANDDTPALPPPGENVERVRLTPAQYEVAERILEGQSTRQIAEALTVEPGTIKSHRRAIAKALGTSEREGLRAVKARWYRE